MQFLLLGILIALTAFFAAGELAVLRLRPSRVERLIEEKKSGANSVNRLQRKLRMLLMVTQLGITFSLVAMGWSINDFSRALWPPEAPSKLIGETVLFISCVTLLTLLGGLVPKALVLSRTE